ncbi:hypothetical protein DTO021C3_8484 [Paecilomyces variotii]|nr:hypothetical protein DTO021C3_8484 [Paecilomyces variotii]KAJ9356453.1 hypothetical protein DTO027B9_3665 [Paecilomyces variotii]
MDHLSGSAGTHARHVVEESPTRFKQPTDSPAFTRPGFNLEVDDLLIPASGLTPTPGKRADLTTRATSSRTSTSSTSSTSYINYYTTTSYF